ncbi:cytochrome b/b6 domain-containing protein [Leucobacter chinensis]|uniref:cytochrome b/b6 domain-containing protein n=1 Tax=Leucobacter chinensis TaxID=2851010 RepID=UPI001C22C20D|nr:cytochrome b/b6 domain-containing protein [Leucobacter chinensis]
MATYTGQVRQGLPRTPGAEPWPAGGVLATTEATVQATPAPVADAPVAAPAPAQAVQETNAQAPVAQQAPEQEAPAQSVAPAPQAGSAQVLRQGLPRVAGGEPWPAGGTPPGAAPAAAPTAAPVAAAPAAEAPVATAAAEAAPAAATPTAAPAAAATAAPAELREVALRRGLPRVAGGEPWPPEGVALQAVPVAPAAPAAAPAAQAPAAQPAAPVAAPAPAPAAQAEPTVQPAAQAQPAAAQAQPVAQAQKPATQPAAKAAPAKPKREPVMIRGKQLAWWVKVVVLGGLGAIVAAAILVLAARGVTTLPGVPEWLERYPGEYELPESSEPGFPAWARWGHFFNIFLMVLIIRSGLLVRTQQQPPAFWTPKKGGKKISINLWLHTSLDILWIVNGLIFVVLLFASGHWVRIVPTSWEVFPNAASSLLQYMTLDWPVENGWVNYNSLQQIMYFLVVFVASPIAIITGVRMSEWWPKDAEKLNKMFPAPLARAVHFPTMLFFVLFILIHVFLVFATGALRNLNHMFAGTDVVNWTGFWLFALSIAITVAGWFACKPLVLAPIAGAFGKVSNR